MGRRGGLKGRDRCVKGAKSVTIRAHAKINLCLEVVGKRPDGFHELATVFAALSLADTVRVRVRAVREQPVLPSAEGPLGGVKGPFRGQEGVFRGRFGTSGPLGASGEPKSTFWGPFGTISVRCEGWSVPSGPANLCYRAAAEFLQRVPPTGPVAVEVTVVKRLPPGGGLGGGSSNAAAVIRALQVLLGVPSGIERARWGTDWSPLGSGKDGGQGRAVEAAALAAAQAVGSDVAFFLAPEPLALARGRGDQIDPVRPPTGRPEAHFVVAWPGAGVGTAWAYSLLSPASYTDGSGAKRLAEILQGGGPLPGDGALYRNAFRGPVASRRPDIAGLMERVRSLGARVVGLAGSGACVWGLFDDRRAAQEAAGCLRAQGLWAQACRVAARPVEIVDPP